MINGFLRNKKMSLFWAKARMRLGRERRCKWHRMWGTAGPWLVPPAQRGTKLRDEGAEMGGFGRFGMKWVANNKLQGIHQRGRLNYDCRGTIIRLGWRFASEVKWQQEICCLGSFQQRQLTLNVSHFKSTPFPFVSIQKKYLCFSVVKLLQMIKHILVGAFAKSSLTAQLYPIYCQKLPREFSKSPTRYSPIW